MFPMKFQKKLFLKIKACIHNLLYPNIGMNIPEFMAYFTSEMNRIDYDLPAPPIPLVRVETILNVHDLLYLQQLVVKIVNKIRAGVFTPKLRGGIMDTKMYSIVPQHSIMQRHVPIDRECFRSLLNRAGYINVPTQQ